MTVKVGQVWKDRDWRTQGNRFIKVVAIEGEKAVLITCAIVAGIGFYFWLLFRA